MSLFKIRSGGSLFRINNLEGYYKYLVNKDSSNDSDIGKLSNKMGLSFIIMDEDSEYNKMALTYVAKRNEYDE